MDYQDKKNEIVLKHTGIELIPHVVKITEKELKNKEKREKIIFGFIKSNQLSEVNCLHCLIHDDDCNECQYSTMLDSGCRDSNSLFNNANKIWEPLIDKEAGDDLEDLGRELEERLSLY